MHGTPPLSVREATSADAPAIAAIYAPAVLHGTASYEEEPPDAAEMARRMADVQAKGLPWLVATEGTRVLGYAYASPFRTRPAYRFTIENSVYVADGAQGRGVGRLLMQDLLGRCRTLGFRKVVAVIGDRRNEGSVRLHRSLGFAEAGVLPGIGVKFGQELDLLLMVKALP
ncbi:N-acetyltransferase [Aerophototrophica crusticola]|uniref:N-acetyltransferase n=1 Tax=Aerophototrophica crusticola TaxID=1709002 RepID=A0A858R3Q7_9PROT|nr:N-acetyltransferase [Rhodospirillaceae bacterium B3]